MVIDTSAVLAILFDEPRAAEVSRAIEGASSRLISAASVLEASIVIEARLGEAGGRELDYLLFRGGFDVVPVDRNQVDIARSAYRRFGKGRHPAALNFGDCFSYALSRVRNEPLCFTGSDFARTDVDAALTF